MRYASKPLLTRGVLEKSHKSVSRETSQIPLLSMVVFGHGSGIWLWEWYFTPESGI